MIDELKNDTVKYQVAAAEKLNREPYESQIVIKYNKFIVHGGICDPEKKGWIFEYDEIGPVNQRNTVLNLLDKLLDRRKDR